MLSCRSQGRKNVPFCCAQDEWGNSLPREQERLQGVLVDVVPAPAARSGNEEDDVVEETAAALQPLPGLTVCMQQAEAASRPAGEAGFIGCMLKV